MAKSKQASAAPPALRLAARSEALDPGLASLFAASTGPAKPRPKEAYHQSPPKGTRGQEDESEEEAAAEEDDEELSSVDEELPDDDEDDEDEGSDVDMQDAAEPDSDEAAAAPAHEALTNGDAEKSQRKRKRKGDEDELEAAYMRKLAKEEAKEDAKRKAERSTKRLKKDEGEAAETSDEDDEDAASEDASLASEDEAESDFEVPQHESQAPSGSKGDTELEKAARTVFLGNVSTRAIASKSDKKTLVKHMSSFLSELPAHTPPHKLESLRFRSTAFSTHIPKKAAFAKKEVMDETSHSTNAYVVYSTQQAAREAARRLNGTVVLDRHLRVDEVAHPAKTDHRRCVFVGNLGFVDDESMVQEATAERFGKKISKKKEPGDVEEGLWRQFGKVGTVESVRVVRDPKTRVGKGFAYVQFTDENAVEAALLYNDKKFPPMLPRKLRVVRAKAVKRNAKPNPTSSTRPITAKGVYNPKISPEERSMQGRAAKLLGKAGAAKIRSKDKPIGKRERDTKPAEGFKTPEQFVFEGHRASERQGKSGLKLGGKKKAGKPTSRSSKRGAAWKAAGGRKA